MERLYQFPSRDRSHPDPMRTNSETGGSFVTAKPSSSHEPNGFVDQWSNLPYPEVNSAAPDYDMGDEPGFRGAENGFYGATDMGDGTAMDEDRVNATPHSRYMQDFDLPMENHVKVPGAFYDEVIEDLFVPAGKTLHGGFLPSKFSQPVFPSQSSVLALAPAQDGPSPMHLSSPEGNPQLFTALQGLSLDVNQNQPNEGITQNSSNSNMSGCDNGPSPLHQSIDSYTGTTLGAFVNGPSGNYNDGTYMNELSPFTTNNSLTPSAGSIHSTQPSFFSAHQFLNANSVDQGPPSAMHRPSLDLYSLRPSLDSQQSTPLSRRESGQNGRYSSFTNSISNYIPFMNDRQRPSDALSKITTPPSPSSPAPQKFTAAKSSYQDQQSRHLIRSIFKSNGPSIVNTNQDGDTSTGDLDENSNNDNINEFLIMSPKDEVAEMDFSDKKLKRSKRSIFTRFKTPTKNETVDPGAIWPDQEMKNGEVKPDPDASDMDTDAKQMFRDGYYDFVPPTMEQAPLEESISPMYVQREPNYAALFQNVGKRRVTKTKAKQSKIKQEQVSEGESGFNSLNSMESKIKREPSLDLGELLAAKNSNNPDNSNLSIGSDRLLLASEISRSSHDTQDSEVHSTGIANASKRILGLKLMSKRKTNVRRQTPDLKDTNVEIDFKDLNLPDDTEVISGESKYRIRGRKENKEADLVDESKIFVCSYCSRRFKRQEHLKRHFRSLHTQEKPYDCEICHKKFSRSDNLNQHLKIHKLEAIENDGEEESTND